MQVDTKIQEAVNNNLENALSQILTKSANAVGSAQDFLIAEIPDVVKQFLVVEFARSAYIVALTAIILWFCVWVTKKAARYNKEYDVFQRAYLSAPAGSLAEREARDSKEAIQPFMIVSVILSVVSGAVAAAMSVVALTSKIPAMLTIYFAPKIYMLEYAAEIIKKAT